MKTTSRCRALVAALTAAAAWPSFAPAARAATSSPWSAPAQLGSCPSAGPARAAFPRDEPSHATGAGAVVWSGARSCPGGGGVLVAPIGPGDVPRVPAYARGASGARVALRPPLAVAPAPHGEIAIAGSSSSPSARDGALVQGAAAGPFAPLGAIAGPAGESTLFTAYLGDLAAVSPTGGGGPRAGVRVDVERYFARSLSPPRLIPARAGAVSDVTVSLDYRTDAIVVWRRRGALYAAELPGRGGARPTQRLASAGAPASVAALISDDERAIVAWSERRGASTSVYVDASGAGVRFGAPQLIERFSDPAGAPPAEGSPRLVRLSSESVMLAWNGAQSGHRVVRTAAIDLNGVGRASTISDPGGEALLDDLQPGPRGEAIALWSEPQPAPGGGVAQTAIVAARGFDSYPDRTVFGAPEQVAAPGANSQPTLAIDPASDRALALWRGAGGAIEYAVREAPHG